MFELISYGKNQFIAKRYNKIRNKRCWNKPIGGLWSSPVDSEYGWKEFIHQNLHKSPEYIRSYIKFILSPDSRVYKIDSEFDLKNVPSVIFSPLGLYIDYQEMSKTYDAIWLTIKGERATRFGKSIDLYGWDCETVLILNPGIIEFPRLKIILSHKVSGGYKTMKGYFGSYHSLLRYYRKIRCRVGVLGLVDPIVSIKTGELLGRIEIKYSSHLPGKQNNMNDSIDFTGLV